MATATASPSRRIAKTEASSKDKHKKLKDLSVNVKSNIFEMLRLASDILGDPDYVDEFGGEHRLMDVLEENEFSHFGGTPSLASMIRAYRKNPTREAWRKYKDNIRAMIELANDRGAEGEKQTINWKALAKQLQIRVDQLEVSLKESRELNEKLTENISSMLQENGELVGKVKVLWQMRR